MALIIEQDGEVVFDAPLSNEDGGKDEALAILWAGQLNGLVTEGTNAHFDGEQVIEAGEFKVEVSDSIKASAEETLAFGQALGLL